MQDVALDATCYESFLVSFWDRKQRGMGLRNPVRPFRRICVILSIQNLQLFWSLCLACGRMELLARESKYLQTANQYKSIYESILQGLSIGASTVAGRLWDNAPAVSCTKAGNSGFAVKLLTNMGVRGMFTGLKQMKRLNRLKEQHWQWHRLSKHVDLSWASYTNGRFKVVLQRSACLHMCKP